MLVVACEIILSSPGTGTLYSNLPVPRSQVPGPMSQVPSPKSQSLDNYIQNKESVKVFPQELFVLSFSLHFTLS